MEKHTCSPELDEIWFCYHFKQSVELLEEASLCTVLRILKEETDPHGVSREIFSSVFVQLPSSASVSGYVAA